MERNLVGKRPTFHTERKGPNFYRVVILLALILGAFWVFLKLQRGEMVSPLDPTPTPTRLPQSYFLEAQAYVDAGRLYDASNNTLGPGVPEVNDAIDAYRKALVGNPDNAVAWAELARIQTYSSSLLSNDLDRRTRLEEALESVNNAAKLAPDDSTVHAIRAFVLDWYAFNALVSAEERQDLLIEAEREASRAFQLDPENALALAYYAEILADQQKWTQAEKYAAQAVESAPDLMDTHRVYGYVLETLGQYNSAIQQYQEAAEITPNMTFLYIRIGQNFREGIRNPDRALDYFDRAAKINDGLGVRDPVPYIEIARTYTQLGQFFAASVNAEKALEFDPYNAHTYGQLGIIFRRARNYEGAMSLLKCATVGCTAGENEMGGVDVEGLDLTNIRVAYYYVEYGTNLAFLSRPNENYCAEAQEVLNEVRRTYSDDPTLMSIVEDSEGICRNLQTSPNKTPTLIEGTEEGMEGDMETGESTPAPEPTTTPES